MLTACAVVPDQTDRAAASVAPTTRPAASAPPPNRGASVAGDGETIVTEGYASTPSSLASSTVSRIRTGSKGCPGPKSYRVRATSHTTAVDPVTAAHLRVSLSAHDRTGNVRQVGPWPGMPLRATELAAAVACRLDRRKERGAYPVLFELADRRDRRPPRGRHRVAQDYRVLSRVTQHRRRAVDGLGNH